MNVAPIRDAIYNVMAGSQQIVNLLGNTSGICPAYSEIAAEYSLTEPGTDASTLGPLPSGSNPRARIAMQLVAPSRDRDLRSQRDDLFQLSVWSPSEDVRDAVTDALDRLFDEQPLTAVGFQVKEVFFEAGSDLFDPPDLFYAPNTLRVLSSPHT